MSNWIRNIKGCPFFCTDIYLGPFAMAVTFVIVVVIICRFLLVLLLLLLVGAGYGTAGTELIEVRLFP